MPIVFGFVCLQVLKLNVFKISNELNVAPIRGQPLNFSIFDQGIPTTACQRRKLSFHYQIFPNAPHMCDNAFPGEDINSPESCSSSLEQSKYWLKNKTIRHGKLALGDLCVEIMTIGCSLLAISNQ